MIHKNGTNDGKHITMFAKHIRSCGCEAFEKAIDLA